jgi:hypothetical protein
MKLLREQARERNCEIQRIEAGDYPRFSDILESTKPVCMEAPS